MLIRQPGIGIEVCTLWKQAGRSWWGPLPVPTDHDIERYVPYRELEDVYRLGLGRNFASRLASTTAQLEYEDRRLYVSLWGDYGDGIDDRFEGPATPNDAFVIRTVADYEEMYQHYLDGADRWDYSYQLAPVAGPVTLMK